MAAIARSVVTEGEVRPSRLREVESEFRPESTLLHFRAVDALVLASLPLGQNLQRRGRTVAGRVVAVGKEQT